VLPRDGVLEIKSAPAARSRGGMRPDRTRLNEIMKVIAVTRRGGPDVLETLELPVPDPGPGEIRLRVRAAGINPVDIGHRSIQSRSVLPVIPGMDVAGVVDALGPDVRTPLQIGDRATAIVTGNSSTHGGYAEYVVVPAESVAAAPRGRTFAESAAFLMPALTARQALDALDASPGSTVLVTGAAGAVGRFTVALAKTAGLQVIAVASPTDESRVRSHGADAFVAGGDDVATRVRTIAPNGVDGLIDAAGLRDDIVPAVKHEGRIITVRTARGWSEPPRPDLDVIQIFASHRAKDVNAIRGLVEAVETGILPVEVAATYPASDASEAHRRFERGGVRGRLVLIFSED
jgi:NADPH:quinone reductase